MDNRWQSFFKGRNMQASLFTPSKGTNDPVLSHEESKRNTSNTQRRGIRDNSAETGYARELNVDHCDLDDDGLGSVP